MTDREKPGIGSHCELNLAEALKPLPSTDDDLLRNERLLLSVIPGNVPPVVSWIATARCNMRCSHCYPDSSPNKPGPELSKEQHYKVVELLARAGVQCVILSGGEPMLIPNLHHLVQEITNHGMTVSICTNGSIVMPENAKQLKDAGLNRVSISIDGAEENTHDGLRLYRGAFKRAIKAIQIFDALGISVFADYTATRINRTDFRTLSNVVRQAGAKGVRIKRFLPIGRGQQNMAILSLSKDEMRLLLDEFLPNELSFCYLHDPAAYSYYRVTLGCSQFNPVSIASRLGCSAALSWFGIQPNGDITPCPLLQVPVGRILHDDLESVFSESVEIKRILNRDDRHGACGTCEERIRCGGCRAHAFTLTGDYLAEDPLCLIANHQ